MKLRKRIVATIAAMAALVTSFCIARGVIAEQAAEVTTRAWVMCRPGDWVNVREWGSRSAASLGRLEAGDDFRVTGRTRDGWAEAEVSLEESTGWIYAGYIVFEEPVCWGGKAFPIRSNGRVACRKHIGGDRIAWVVDGSTVQVFYAADGWAVTNRGWIRSEFIDWGAQE